MVMLYPLDILLVFKGKSLIIEFAQHIQEFLLVCPLHLQMCFQGGYFVVHPKSFNLHIHYFLFKLLLFIVNLSTWAYISATSCFFYSNLVDVSPAHPIRRLRSSFIAFSSWRVHSSFVTLSKCNWAIISTYCCPFLVATFFLSNISICSTTSYRPSTLCSTTFIEVLKSNIVYIIDLLLLPPDLTIGTTCPLTIRFLYSMNIMV